MKVRFAALVLVAFLGALPARGQAPGAPAQPAGAAPKVAVLNLRQAIVTSAEGKQASAELQSQFAPQQNELESLRKQGEDLQTRLRTGERTLDDAEKARLARQIDSISRVFQRKQEDLQEDINAAQSEVVERIGRKMLEVLDRYSRENGFALVLDISVGGQPSPVLYHSNQVDITQDIIRLYDQANPVRAAPAAPGQARPQPGQQPPPTRPPQQPPTRPPQQ